MESSRLSIQVSKRNMSLVKFLLEGYGHLAVVVTTDPARGSMEVLTTQPELVRTILEEVREDFSITFLPP